MILITGAAGLSGSIAVKEFTKHNIPVRALVRNKAKAPGALLDHPLVDVVEGDMGRPATLSEALAGVEKVFMISTANLEMVETQCTFIDACKSQGVRHVVKLSGSEPDFDASKFLFTRLHEKVERYLEGSGLRWTHLRPSQFMQVYLREARTIASKGVLALPLGEIELAPIDIRDVARVARRVLLEVGHEGRSYAMTGPEALTMGQIAEHISNATQREVRYVPISIEERHASLLASGTPAYFADALDDQSRERLKRLKSRTRIEIFADLCIVPTRFSEFTRDHAAAFLGQ